MMNKPWIEYNCHGAITVQASTKELTVVLLGADTCLNEKERWWISKKKTVRNRKGIHRREREELLHIMHTAETMDEYDNEYGNSVDDLVRRLDCEYWRIKREEEAYERARQFQEPHDDEEYEDWDGEIDLNDPSSGRRLVASKTARSQEKGVPNKKKAKQETGREMRERIVEKRRLKEVKKGISFGKKLRKEGKMKAITTYFT